MSYVKPSNIKPNSTLEIFEVIDLLKKANTKKERIEILKKHDSKALRYILKLNFDPNLNFAIKERVDYTPSPYPPGFGEISILTSYKRFYIFLDNFILNTRKTKLKNLWIQLLESLDPIEAQIMVDVQQKKLKCGLTKKLLDEVYPGLINWEKENEKEGENSAKGNSKNI